MLDIVDEKEVANILKVKEVDSRTPKNEELSNLPLVKVTELPSGFLGYPEGTTISYNPLTLGELEAINNGDSVDVERGIAMLLNSIHCNTLPAEDLYYWDVIYIGIKRKLLAFGNTTGTIYAQCPKCGNLLERSFEYTELEFKECEAPDLPVITTIAGKEVEISLLTMKDFLQIDTTKGELDVYARMIKNLDYETAYNLIANSYGVDAKKIQYIDKLLTYGIKPLITQCDGEIDNPDFNPDKKVTKTNPKRILCNNEVRMEVRSPFEVVFPENTDLGFDESEIHFGRE